MGNCISPCGDLVFCGSRSGEVHVWDTDVGVRRHRYEAPFNGRQEGTVHAICYHPHDHIVVFGALSSGGGGEIQGRRGKKALPAVVYKFKKEVEEAGREQ